MSNLATVESTMDGVLDLDAFALKISSDNTLR
jgi:hypothetical protein